MRHVTTEEQATEMYLRPTLCEGDVRHTAVTSVPVVPTNGMRPRNIWCVRRREWLILNIVVGIAAAWQIVVFGFASIGYRFVESSKDILPRLHAGMPATELWNMAGKPAPCGQKTLNRRLYRTYAYHYSDGTLFVSVKSDYLVFKEDDSKVDDTRVVVDNWSFQSGM